jgi:hypothetical protein
MAQQPLVGRGLLIVEAARSHSGTPRSVGLLWTVISPTQKPLPNKTRHSKDTDIYAPEVFEPAIPAGERPQPHALDRAATGICQFDLWCILFEKCIDGVRISEAQNVTIVHSGNKTLYHKLRLEPTNWF